MNFDNKTLLNRAKMNGVQLVFDRLWRRGSVHFMCHVGDSTLGYCYIRKNACSSFKRLFVDMGSQDYDPSSWPRRLDYMVSNQAMRSRDAESCDRIVFVYRDPFARAVSLFKNKFIMRCGHDDIFRSYEEIAEESTDEATFRQFVKGYLRRDFWALDPHTLPQCWHLMRIQYSDAIPIEDLHACMSSVIGRTLADRYFKKPLNATFQGNAQLLAGAADLPSREMAELYSVEGTLPSAESFVDEEIMHQIRHLYAEDYEMIDRVRGA